MRRYRYIDEIKKEISGNVEKLEEIDFILPLFELDFDNEMHNFLQKIKTKPNKSLTTFYEDIIGNNDPNFFRLLKIKNIQEEMRKRLRNLMISY